jgi:hypothetical protein
LQDSGLMPDQTKKVEAVCVPCRGCSRFCDKLLAAR